MSHTINQLSMHSGVPVRTIRYYLSQGLIPSAGREGPSTRYPESTLARLRLIRKLQASNHSLAEIKRQLAGLSDEDAIELAGARDTPAPDGSALDYIRSLLGDEPAENIPEPWITAAHRSKNLMTGTSVESIQWAIEPPEPVNQQQAVGDRAQWERIFIGPDIELHVRRPLSRRDSRTVDRLIAFARQLQKEEAL